MPLETAHQSHTLEKILTHARATVIGGGGDVEVCVQGAPKPAGLVHLAIETLSECDDASNVRLRIYMHSTHSWKCFTHALNF